MTVKVESRGMGTVSDRINVLYIRVLFFDVRCYAQMRSVTHTSHERIGGLSHARNQYP